MAGRLPVGSRLLRIEILFSPRAKRVNVAAILINELYRSGEAPPKLFPLSLRTGQRGRSSYLNSEAFRPSSLA